MKLFYISLILFTCNQPVKPVPQPAPIVVHQIYLNTATTSVIGNNSLAINMLNTIGYHGKNNAKFTIDITETGSGDFTLKEARDTLFITGNSFEGVVYFLDRFCGQRFYMPLWTSKPKDSVFIDSALSYSYKQKVTIMSTGITGTDAYIWAKYRMNCLDNSFGITQHSFSKLFFDSSCLKLFPEIYKNGFPKSASDQNFEPDFTSPECVSASMYAARKTGITSFSVMDSWNGFPASSNLTENFTNYINALGDSFKIVFPGKKITYLIYNKIGLPTVRLRDNVIPILVDHISDAIGDNIFDSTRFKNFVNVGNHDWAEGYGFVVPRIYSHLLQRYLLAIKKAGVNFQFAAIEMYPNWSLDGLKYYEMIQLYRNPSLNIDSMRTLFCKDMFGNAAPHMKNYFDDLEALSTSMNNNPLINRHLGDYKSQMTLTVQDETLAAMARASIDSALRIATGTELQRVNFFSNGFKISEGLWKIHNGADSTFISDYKQFIKDSINQTYLNNADLTTVINQIK